MVELKVVLQPLHLGGKQSLHFVLAPTVSIQYFLSGDLF